MWEVIIIGTVVLVMGLVVQWTALRLLGLTIFVTAFTLLYAMSVKAPISAQESKWGTYVDRALDAHYLARENSSRCDELTRMLEGTSL